MRPGEATLPESRAHLPLMPAFHLLFIRACARGLQIKTPGRLSFSLFLSLYLLWTVVYPCNTSTFSHCCPLFLFHSKSVSPGCIPHFAFDLAAAKWYLRAAKMMKHATSEISYATRRCYGIAKILRLMPRHLATSRCDTIRIRLVDGERRGRGFEMESNDSVSQNRYLSSKYPVEIYRTRNICIIYAARVTLPYSEMSGQAFRKW